PRSHHPGGETFLARRVFQHWRSTQYRLRGRTCSGRKAIGMASHRSHSLGHRRGHPPPGATEPPTTPSDVTRSNREESANSACRAQDRGPYLDLQTNGERVAAEFRVLKLLRLFA